MVVVTNGRPGEVLVAAAATALRFETHLGLLRQLMQLSDECLLVSPFLFEDFAPLVDGLALENLRVELISTCAPRGDDQLVKPHALRNFGRVFQTASGSWPTIGIDHALHSKVYVFWKAGRPFFGLVTSANLTRSGLTLNHETGILLTDEPRLSELAATTRENLDYVSLSEYQLDKLCSAAEIIGREAQRAQDREIGLTRLLSLYATPSAGNRDILLREHSHYYIKVSGVSDRPILPKDRRPFDEPHCQLSFAKSPSNITLGDCLLEVAVGGKCFLSYYTCASAVFERTDAEKRQDPDNRRWPYYVYANNLSLHYGEAWFEEPIFYDHVVSDFKATNPDISVTTAGKDDFVGAMQMGHSYISVTKEFGEFVRARIDCFRANKRMDGDAVNRTRHA